MGILRGNQKNSRGRHNRCTGTIIKMIAKVNLPNKNILKSNHNGQTPVFASPLWKDFCNLVILTSVELDPPCIDGVYLSGEEHEFYTLVSTELDHFLQQGNQKAVLLFPPVSSRLRYLIHRLTESYDALSSFSVGEGWQRRTAICHAGIRLPDQDGESKTSSHDQNRGRFWSAPSHSKKWETGRGRQNWRQRKDRRPDRQFYVARGKHWAAGSEGDWRSHDKDKNVSEERQRRALEDGQYGDNGNGEALQKQKKVSEEEMRPCKKEMPEGQEEVQFEEENQEMQEKTSGKIESSGDDRTDNVAACQKLPENIVKERRPGQVAMEAEEVVRDLDMRQDHVDEEQARFNTQRLLEKSVDDQVVSEKKAAKKSERVEEDAETSTLAKDMPERKVEDQDDTEVKAEAHEEMGRKKMAHEEAGMPAEPREEAKKPIEGQKQAEMTVVDKEMTVEIQEQGDIRMVALDDQDQAIGDESTEKNPVQGTEPEQTAQCDEEQQKIMEQLMTEIHSHVCEKDVHIQPLQGDFTEFSEVQVDRGKFGHIIEVYSFSSRLSAEDLMEPFKEYRDRGFRLQWVDQTHALGIFSSPEDAYAASSQMHPAMKFRPLSQGSRQSKSRAYEKAAFMQPHKERPQTDATVARRIVSQALALPKEVLDQSVVERAQT